MNSEQNSHVVLEHFGQKLKLLNSESKCNSSQKIMPMYLFHPFSFLDAVFLGHIVDTSALISFQKILHIQRFPLNPA